jgi:hypothetical protein
MPITASANVVWVLFARRIIDGLTGSTFGVAQASVIDVAEPPRPSPAVGFAGAAFGSGSWPADHGRLGRDRRSPVAVHRRGRALGLNAIAAIIRCAGNREAHSAPTHEPSDRGCRTST